MQTNDSPLVPRCATCLTLDVRQKLQNEMDNMITMILYGGPHDGENIEIHPDTLKIKLRISMRDEKGKITEYALDNQGEFVWLPNPNDPKVARGFFVCDDDGNVISEEDSLGDAMDKLDDLNDD